MSIQFELSYGFHCSPFSFDEVEFFEFINMWDMLAKRKELEAKQKAGNSSTSLESLLGN
jgi:hypothetical protein